jgi:hypothetical protein
MLGMRTLGGEKDGWLTRRRWLCLSWQQVAEKLGVSTASVYKVCTIGYGHHDPYVAVPLRPACLYTCVILPVLKPLCLFPCCVAEGAACAQAASGDARRAAGPGLNPVLVPVGTEGGTERGLWEGGGGLRRFSRAIRRFHFGSCAAVSARTGC